MLGQAQKVRLDAYISSKPVYLKLDKKARVKFVCRAAKNLSQK